MLGREADAHRAGHLQRALVGALLLQALQAGAARRFPTEGPQVVQGPGENAGVLRLPEGWAVAFKIESHNHPSAVEPYQGAATGVGGILRDVFTMGARPVAVLNSLRFGPLDQPAQPLPLRRRGEGRRRLRQLRRRPDPGRRGGLRAGLQRQPAGQRHVRRPAPGGGPDAGRGPRRRATCCWRWARAPGATASTGRASPRRTCRRRARPAARRCRWAIPFTEKLLLEATLELIAQRLVVAIQDMGAAGLTSSSAEMAARGGVGVEIETDKVPIREAGMTPYEIMLSRIAGADAGRGRAGPGGGDPGGVRASGSWTRRRSAG